MPRSRGRACAECLASGLWRLLTRRHRHFGIGRRISSLLGNGFDSPGGALLQGRRSGAPSTRRSPSRRGCRRGLCRFRHLTGGARLRGGQRQASVYALHVESRCGRGGRSPRRRVAVGHFSVGLCVMTADCSALFRRCCFWRSSKPLRDHTFPTNSNVWGSASVAGQQDKASCPQQCSTGRHSSRTCNGELPVHGRRAITAPSALLTILLSTSISCRIPTTALQCAPPGIHLQ